MASTAQDIQGLRTSRQQQAAPQASLPGVRNPAMQALRNDLAANLVNSGGASLHAAGHQQAMPTRSQNFLANLPSVMDTASTLAAGFQGLQGLRTSGQEHGAPQASFSGVRNPDMQAARNDFAASLLSGSALSPSPQHATGHAPALQSKSHNFTAKLSSVMNTASALAGGLQGLQAPLLPLLKGVAGAAAKSWLSRQSPERISQLQTGVTHALNALQTASTALSMTPPTPHRLAATSAMQLGTGALQKLQSTMVELSPQPATAGTPHPLAYTGEPMNLPLPSPTRPNASTSAPLPLHLPDRPPVNVPHQRPGHVPLQGTTSPHTPMHTPGVHTPAAPGRPPHTAGLHASPPPSTSGAHRPTATPPRPGPSANTSTRPQTPPAAPTASRPQTPTTVARPSTTAAPLTLGTNPAEARQAREALKGRGVSDAQLQGMAKEFRTMRLQGSAEDYQAFRTKHAGLINLPAEMDNATVKQLHFMLQAQPAAAQPAAAPSGGSAGNHNVQK